jgi:hypothetical protein
MNGGMEVSSLLDVLLLHVFRHRITAPDADAGIERLAVSADCDAVAEEWRVAVAEALAAGYIHDPVRLPVGALQCHWHLELTPRGVEVAQRLRALAGDFR